MSADGLANGHLPTRSKAGSSNVTIASANAAGTAASIATSTSAAQAAATSNAATSTTASITSGLDTANTLAEVQAGLGLLSAREDAVNKRLEGLLRSQADLRRDLGRLDLLRAHLGTQAVTTRAVSNGILSNASSGARRITNQVRQLDLERARVRDTLKVVEQVAELKTCVLGVTGSMGAPQDWETAAKYIYRASQIPEEIVKGSFAEKVVPTAEVPDSPAVTLENAAESLCGLFMREFEKAVEDEESARITRFFKLFPLIGRADVGLDLYGRYVSQGVASRARFNLNTGLSSTTEGFFYSNVLTKLFEHIAQIVDSHRSLVERHYDAKSMVRVIGKLQVGVDVQGGIIIDTWVDERQIQRKLTDIKSYAFSFLLQSFLPAQKQIQRTGSPAQGPGAKGATEDDSVDTKEIDAVLKEAGTMLSRWAAYSRFIGTVCQQALEPDTEGPLVVPTLLEKSSLTRRINDDLISSFNAMTMFFVRRSVEKAFQLDEAYASIPISIKPNAGPPTSPYITSAVEDTMIIIREVLQRAISTSQRVVVESVASTIGRVLGSDFLGMIQRKMRHESNPRPAVQGGIPSVEKVQSFLILMNNLDTAMQYIKMIVSRYLQESVSEEDQGFSLDDLFPFGRDAQAVKKTLENLQHGFESKASELLSDANKLAHEQILRPQLRPLLSDSLRDIDYVVNEEVLSERRRLVEELTGDAGDLSGDDLVRIRFEHGWQPLISTYKAILTEKNFDRLLSTTCTSFAKLLERKIWSYDGGRVNELGAIHLERDITSIVNAVSRGGKYGLRDSMMKVTQLCMVMNMEEDEWQEIMEMDKARDSKEGEDLDSGSGIEWKLDVDERRRARDMVRNRS